jgi:hypothetical protein
MLLAGIIGDSTTAGMEPLGLSVIGMGLDVLMVMFLGLFLMTIHSVGVFLLSWAT